MKYLIPILVFVAAAGLYLNRSYSHIYSSIGKANLQSPRAPLITSVVPATGTSVNSFTYVALGDSLTAGVGATTAAEIYPYVLSRMVAEKRGVAVTLINLSEPGAVARNVLDAQLPRVFAYKPDAVTMLIGVNDMHNFVAPSAFFKTLAAIIHELDAHHIPTVVMTLPYLGAPSVFLPPYSAYFDLQTRRYNNAVRAATAGTSATIADLYNLTRARASVNSYYAADGFHPSAASYAYWSALLYDYLPH